jgi:hypothetical protein
VSSISIMIILIYGWRIRIMLNVFCKDYTIIG